MSLWTPNQDLDFQLKDFQEEDVAKLLEVPSALIANEMGSGKTYEAVALDILRRKQHGHPDGGRLKTLIICPLSTVETTWVRHYLRLAPELNGYFVDPKKRSEFIWALSQPFDYYIIHWDAIRLKDMEPALQQTRWFHIIGDEIHKVKNRKAQTTKALKKIKNVEYKTGLSGTPAANMAHDIWSILNWLYPKKFSSYWNFYKEFVEFEIKYPQGFHVVKGIWPHKLPEFHAMIDPFYVRHLKKERCCDHHPNGVMEYLPDKYWDDIWVDLEPAQRRAYDAMAKDMLAWIGQHENQPLPAPVVVAQLIRLQQFAVASAEMVDGTVMLTKPSSKLKALMELVEDNPGKQFVVFSQFTKLINLICQELSNAKVSNAAFTGQTPQEERAGIIERFQAGDIQLFVGNMKAGGVGIDLFAASTVVFMDRAWSPVDNVQAEDRLWREGQENAVQVIDIMARNTVDLGRRQRLEQKWEWLKALLGDK
jgi:SNF2 family DNA or RNA helicase